MSDLLKEGNAAGTRFRVGDYHVWAAIQYLDSPTDYREYLPEADPRAPAAKGELVMLDSSRPHAKVLPAVVISIGAILLILGYLLCLILQVQGL
jgi:hypothetical protein